MNEGTAGTKEGLTPPASGYSKFVEAPFVDKGVYDSAGTFRFRLFFERIYTLDFFTSGNVSSIILNDAEGANNMSHFRGAMKLQPHHFFRKLLHAFEVVTGVKILSFQIIKQTSNNLELVVIHEPKEKAEAAPEVKQEGVADDAVVSLFCNTAPDSDPFS